MTTADRNMSRRREEIQTSAKDPRDPPPHQSVHHDLSASGHDTEDRASHLELCHSPGLRPRPATRDSGYNTGDVSPATTISPATNTPRHQHFVFDDLEPSRTRDPDGGASSYGHACSPLMGVASASSSPCLHPPYPDDPRLARPPLRLSPGRVSPALGVSGLVPGNKPTSRPASETSDTCRVQFDFESDYEAEEDISKRDDKHGRHVVLPLQSSAGHRDLAEQLCRDNDDDIEDDDDENVFYSPSYIGIEPISPRYRTGSLSLRERRYCSNPNEGNGGPVDESPALCFRADTQRDQRSHSFSEPPQRGRSYSTPCPGSKHDILSHARQFDINPGLAESSQSFQGAYFQNNSSKDSIPENVFTFDPDDLDGYESEARSPVCRQRATSATLPIVREKPPQSPASRARRRRISVTTHLRMASGYLLPWPSSCPGAVNVSTQTPHMTSIMIQQVMDTPVALPNEARGSAASRLRRLSESGVPLPPTPTPLPDIIPRDRSQSVPDIQGLVRRQRAQEAGRSVGRELRRLSDEFNFSFSNRRILTPVHEEFDGHPASFPRMRRSNVHSVLSQFGTFIRDTFGSRRESSVDCSSQLSLRNLNIPQEEEPGD